MMMWPWQNGKKQISDSSFYAGGVVESETMVRFYYG